MENTKPKHKLYDHPYLGGLVALVLVLVILQTFGSLPVGVAKIIQGERPELGITEEFVLKMQHISNFLSIALAAACLLIHKCWFRKDGYKGVFARNGFRNKEAWMFVLAALVVDITLTAANAIVTGVMPVLPTITTVLISLEAGICEETTFRAIPVAIMMKNNPSHKRMWTGALIAAVVFGVTHMSNVGAGAAFAGAIVQSVNAVCLGLLMGAIYLRTGNIFLTMVFHTIHDIIGLMDPAQATGVVTQTSYSALDIVILAAVAAAYAAAGIYLLRKSKWEEIKATWANIWSE